MWIFTRYGFYSVVCARVNGPQGELVDPDTVVVRARRRDHIEALQRRIPALGGTDVLVQPHSDYRFRIKVAKKVWAGALADLAEEQTWDNFKNEAHRYQGRDGDEYVSLLHRIWREMYAFQEGV